jgi:hypothetical protein
VSAACQLAHTAGVAHLPAQTYRPPAPSPHGGTWAHTWPNGRSGLSCRPVGRRPATAGRRGAWPPRARTDWQAGGGGKGGLGGAASDEATGPPARRSGRKPAHDTYRPADLCPVASPPCRFRPRRAICPPSATRSCNNYNVSPGGALLLVSDRSDRFVSLFKPRGDRDAARSNADGDSIR